MKRPLSHGDWEGKSHFGDSNTTGLCLRRGVTRQYLSSYASICGSAFSPASLESSHVHTTCDVLLGSKVGKQELRGKFPGFLARTQADGIHGALGCRVNNTANK